MKQYTINRLPAEHEAGVMPSVQEWENANVLNIDNFRPEGSDARPDVKCRVLYDASGLYLRYSLKDRWVKCVAKNYQDSVCEDSCVEFFVEPVQGKGYMNFELNACGVMLLYHVIDWTEVGDAYADYYAVGDYANEAVKRYPTLKPEDVSEEITEPCNWELGVYVPFSVLSKEFGLTLQPKKGTVWHGNFYTCADGTSHPRWAAWSPVNVLNFHLPECFGEIIFG
ncbi:MAG: hypothetical protein E7040_12205 [Lentisphaerae bacterium]|nr:hypothetical protein [Lentisphaerota bacterium]